ncbi:DASS family sodium-coupled anion symporter [Thalassospira sp.]|uniref:SLC13 family permease n=1 Tax=Thalassospira sp. TaxID=1912094 RepID=UPI002736D4BB|nr:DASS family sodium-coupled anion symporter [Thalassospira sp.]MDP2698031.1 DASS family sodium-coupled anion symporter [Thalassospira sp.]
MFRFPLIDRLPFSSTGANPASPRRPGVPRRLIGLCGGILAFGGMLMMSPPDGMGLAAWHAAALAALMAIWWLSEAIPIAATALLPVALAPLLSINTVETITPHYANPLLFMFLGGFVIALAMERWNLHQRIALLILARVGFRPASLVGGFIGATAFLSMWVSNTATATMMLPIALSLIHLLRDHDGMSLAGDDDNPAGKLSPPTRNLALSLLLGIAFGASIGGVGTLIGTPPNALLAGYFAATHGIQIGFGQWMLIGVPFATLLLLACWFLLTRVVYPLDDALPDAACKALQDQIDGLGPMSRGERTVAIVFAVTASLWLLRPALQAVMPGIPLGDASIAMLAAVALFAIPVKARENLYILDWKATIRLPWGVLLLVGGGLALGGMINDTGLAAWLAGNAGNLPDLPLIVQIGMIGLMVILISHLTSNTATAATFLPLVSAYALAEGIDPMLLAIPTALAASCAFMLPVATPPNAIVFGSGYLSVAEMVRAGFLINLCALVLLVIVTLLIVPVLF